MRDCTWRGENGQQDGEKQCHRAESKDAGIDLGCIDVAISLRLVCPVVLDAHSALEVTDYAWIEVAL